MNEREKHAARLRDLAQWIRSRPVNLLPVNRGVLDKLVDDAAEFLESEQKAIDRFITREME